MQAPPAPVTIPIPENFPVAWQFPEEQLLPWRQDRQHSPRATVPLSGSTAGHFAEGANLAAEALNLPIRFNSRLFNCYYYLAIAPVVPPMQMAEAEMAAVHVLIAQSEKVADRWANEWLPEIQQRWDAWSAVESSRLDDGALLQRYDELVELYRRVWDIHFELLFPAFLAWSGFMDFAREHLGANADLEAAKMLQGIDNLSLQAGRRMWVLSRAALADPRIAQTVREGEAETVFARLGEFEAGRQFRAAVQAFLEDFGRRSDTVQDLQDPSWIEEPGMFFKAFRPYLANDQDPDVRHRELAAEREAAVARAHQQLAGAAPEVRARFEALLQAAQDCSRLQEDHNHWIDQRSLHEARKLALEIGERFLQRGQVDRPEDALYLYEPELRQAIVNPGMPLRELVAGRRAELARFAQVQAPPMIGTDYGPPPPESPVGKAMSRFFGGPPPAPQEEILAGIPGSAGVYRGIARVIPTFSEAGRLDVGEILVAPTTSPPWTPLFATAGAIVTDTGGPLSHCAIVAREYGIPAVVGTGFGTAQIRDGQLIEVDGGAGIVRFLD